MKVLVQKFGGTSVADADVRQRAVEKVRDAVVEGYAVVVVVSAMGRSGDPYATDTLLGLLPEGSSPRGQEVDLLLSCGEIISSVVFASELRRWGLDAAVLTGGQAGIITDSSHGEARVVRVVTAKLEGLLKEGLIPVVAGFQGASESGEVTTLGRGGSDTTAAALGAALRAARVDIYTDVSGIMTADPRLVPEAGILDRVDYSEVFQLAALGAKVIHPRAVEIARQARVPLRVLGIRGESGGTVIENLEELRDTWAHRRPEASIVGVSVQTGVVQLKIRTPYDTGEGQRRLFREMAARGISVDLINVFPDFTAFLVQASDRASAEDALRQLEFEAEIRDDVAKVSAVGTAIHGLPGVMSVVVDALGECGIPILQSSDSHQSISCLVPKDRIADAATALHRAFGLGVTVRPKE